MWSSSLLPLLTSLGLAFTEQRAHTPSVSNFFLFGELVLRATWGQSAESAWGGFRVESRTVGLKIRALWSPWVWREPGGIVSSFLSGRGSTSVLLVLRSRGATENQWDFGLSFYKVLYKAFLAVPESSPLEGNWAGSNLGSPGALPSCFGEGTGLKLAMPGLYSGTSHQLQALTPGETEQPRPVWEHFLVCCSCLNCLPFLAGSRRIWGSCRMTCWL